MTDSIRPTKKQKELLNCIDNFIKGSGYSPSFREIMRALDYKSVSTVATHIEGLIARGWLVKRDNSARSLEVVGVNQTPAEVEIRAKIRQLESEGDDVIDQINILEQALDILTTDSSSL